MGRSPCCSKVGLRRGPWSSKEDALLTDFIQQNGEGQWRSLPKKAGLLRCGKSCRLRWMNYLRPGIKRGNIGEDEEDLIVRLHGLLGNRWSLIAGRLPGRTDNEIKNYWNTHLIKKLSNAGIQQNPHKELPKPNKNKNKNKNKNSNDAGKKKKEQKSKKAAIANIDKEEENREEPPIEHLNNDPPKIKVYLPKPIRITSSFPRVNSFDSLGSQTSSSDGGDTAEKAAESYEPVALSALLELEDFPCVDDGDEDEFLGGGYILPMLQHSDSISSDVNMLDIMLDEFRRLV